MTRVPSLLIVSLAMLAAMQSGCFSHSSNRADNGSTGREDYLLYAPTNVYYTRQVLSYDLPRAATQVAAVRFTAQPAPGLGQMVFAFNYTGAMDSALDAVLVSANGTNMHHLAVWPAPPNKVSAKAWVGPSISPLGTDTQSNLFGGLVNVTEPGQYDFILGYQAANFTPHLNVFLFNATRSATHASLQTAQDGFFFGIDGPPTNPGEFEVLEGPAQFRLDKDIVIHELGALILDIGVVPGTASIHLVDPAGHAIDRAVFTLDVSNPNETRLDMALGPGTWHLSINATWIRGAMVISIVDAPPGRGDS